jgi:hypothetical protein
MSTDPEGIKKLQIWIKESEPWPTSSHRDKVEIQGKKAKTKQKKKTWVGCWKELASLQSLTQKNVKDYFSRYQKYFKTIF